MCTLSMTFDYGNTVPMDRWLQQGPMDRWLQQGIRTSPYPTNVLVSAKTPLDIFEELVAKSMELDRALGLADCEDPAKMEWLEKVRAAVREHEHAKIEKRLGA